VLLCCCSVGNCTLSHPWTAVGKQQREPRATLFAQESRAQYARDDAPDFVVIIYRLQCRGELPRRIFMCLCASGIYAQLYVGTRTFVHPLYIVTKSRTVSARACQHALPNQSTWCREMFHPWTWRFQKYNTVLSQHKTSPVDILAKVEDYHENDPTFQHEAKSAWTQRSFTKPLEQRVTDVSLASREAGVAASTKNTMRLLPWVYVPR